MARAAALREAAARAAADEAEVALRAVVDAGTDAPTAITLGAADVVRGTAELLGADDVVAVVATDRVVLGAAAATVVPGEGSGSLGHLRAVDSGGFGTGPLDPVGTCERLRACLRAVDDRGRQGLDLGDLLFGEGQP